MIVNGLALALVVTIVPGLHLEAGHVVVAYLVLGLLLGLLNAFVKPAIQFVAFPLLLGSFGLVVVLIDVLVFGLLRWLTPLLRTSNVWSVVAGGILLGVLCSLLDNLLGLNPPIVARPRRDEG